MNIDIIRITEKERASVFEENKEKIAKKEVSKESLDKFLDANENQTLAMFRKVKNLAEWKDIDVAVNFVNILEKMEEAEKKKPKSVELDLKEVELLRLKFKEVMREGKIDSDTLNRFTAVYKTLSSET